MFINKADRNKSKTIEALIPMVDLFAVLAIVFMIYSSDEIIASQEQSQETIEQIATDYKKLQETVAALNYAGRLCVTLHYDPRPLAAAEAEALLDRRGSLPGTLARASRARLIRCTTARNKNGI